MSETSANPLPYGEIRNEIRHYGEKLLTNGLTKGTGEDVSRLTRDGHIAISQSEIPYQGITPEEVPIVDHRGERIHGPYEASVQFPMHRMVYIERSDISAIVHTHSPYATTFASLGTPIAPSHYLVARLGDEVPVAEYATFGTDELGRSVVEALGDKYSACLLENHGVLSVGDSLDAAIDTALTVEFCARIQYQAQLLGDPIHLSEDEIGRLKSKFEGYGEH